MRKPRFFSYGEYSSGNYGVNSMAFEDKDGNIFYFSYETLVAFRVDGKLIVIKNYWGSTTGKHLNWIDRGNKIDRLTKDLFDQEYYKYFGGKK